MNLITKVKNNPKFYLILALGRILPDTIKCNRFYLKLMFKNRMKKKLNLDNPKTYNEKLQWLKIYDRKSEYGIMVDKYAVKYKVASIIGEEYTIPTLGIWNSFADIDFDKLPKQFVLKCTHDSGGLIICKDKSKLDLKLAEEKINHCLKRNYYLNTREWPYKNVKHRIIAEKYISQSDGGMPVDYKFFCFGGEIDNVMVCVGRDQGKPQFIHYDMKWNRLLYQNYEPELIEPIEKPENFDLMIKLVKKLSQGYSQIRIDLYNIDGKIYFGEYTFFNQSGMDRDISLDTDKYWGDKINI